MIDGTTVRLRAWGESDLNVLLELRNDIALQAQLLARPRGSSAEQVRRWVEERSARKDGLFFIVADYISDAALGFLQISEMDLFDRRAEMGICLVRESQRRGVGSESLALVSEYLCDTWRLRKLSLRVRADNQAAIRCYRKCGFEEVGILREHNYIEGAWRDIVLMDMFLAGRN